MPRSRRYPPLLRWEIGMIRGSPAQNHFGNRHYMHKVRLFVPLYVKAPTNTKSQVAMRLVTELTEEEGFMFVKFDEERKEWAEFNDMNYLHQKVQEALRCEARKVRETEQDFTSFWLDE